MPPCPSAETLGRLGDQTPGGADFAPLEAHVEGCPACRAVLERLAGEDGHATGPARPLVPGPGDAPDLPGFVIGGELGRGGMGVVYKARQPGLGRDVALKVVPSGPAAGSRERERWLREARSVTRVRHPGVVQLHQVGEAKGWLYLVLGYVPGGSLKDRLRGPLPPRAAAGLVEPIARAVHAVHRAGLLHLDLKPSNILLDSAPDAPWDRASPRVSDFGIARLWDENGGAAASMAGPYGTPCYMAPEQVAGNPAAIGPPADVYALGAILYELMTGRRPFETASLAETLDRVRGEEPAPARRLNPRIPRDLETVCSACLQKDPRRRYPTAEALADDLARWRDGLPVRARPVRAAGRVWRWCRRRPLPASLLVALALTWAVSSVWLVILWNRSDAQRGRAEVSRANAEANYLVATRSLNQLVDVLRASTESGSPYSRPVDPLLTRYLESALEQERAFRAKNPLDEGAAERLAVVDYLLANEYVRLGRRGEARVLLQESMDLDQAGGSRPSAPGGEIADTFLHLLQLGTLIEPVHEEEGLARWERTALTFLARTEGTPSHAESVRRLANVHRVLAEQLLIAGAAGRARRLLEGDLKRLDALPASRAPAPETVLTRVLTLAALGRWSGVLEPLPTAGDGRTISAEWVRGVLNYLGELNAMRVGWIEVPRAPGTPPPGDDPGAPWAERAPASFRSQFAALGLDPAAVPRMVWTMHPYAAHAAMRHRQKGRLGAAGKVVDDLNRLTDQVAACYPEQVPLHLLRTEVFLQRAKNAWKADDSAAAEEALESSLRSALRATALDPEDEEARFFVNDRRRRLSKSRTGPTASR